ncbi:hypothetical protein ACVWWH_002936 [Sinomonas sp. RB5]
MSAEDHHPKEPSMSAQSERFDALLAESGIEARPGDPLVPALAELAALGGEEPFAPSPELAALLRDADRDHRRRARRRPASRRRRAAVAAFTAVCVGGAGAAAAAADEGFRQAAGKAMFAIIGTLTGTRPEAPGTPGPGHAPSREASLPSPSAVPPSPVPATAGSPTASGPAAQPTDGTPAPPAVPAHGSGPGPQYTLPPRPVTAPPEQPSAPPARHPAPTVAPRPTERVSAPTGLGGEASAPSRQRP